MSDINNLSEIEEIKKSIQKCEEEKKSLEEILAKHAHEEKRLRLPYVLKNRYKLINIIKTFEDNLDDLL